MEDSRNRARYVGESDYSNRVPSPPRIKVALPNCPNDYLPIQLNASNGEPILEALRFLDEHDNEKPRPSPSLSWNYAMRHEAQQILPFLYLGPMNAVGNRDFLRNERITMLLAVRPTAKQQSPVLTKSLAIADELGLQKGTIDVMTNPELIASLPVAAQMINEHLIQVHQSNGGHGKVLVFCETGNDRSAVVVVAYMMQMFVDMDLVKAIQNVQARRLSVNINEDRKFLLSGYWDILKAKQDIATQAQQVGAGHEVAEGIDGGPRLAKNGIGSKRDHDTFADEFMVSMGDGEMDSDGRDFAPFRDA